MSCIHPPLPTAEYNRQWIARVLAGCDPLPSGCIVWRGSKNHKGYGQTNYRGRTKHVHRMLYEVVHGITLATVQFVCHSCDVRACCNIAHLWLGNAKDNYHDSAAKKRTSRFTIIRCKHGHEYTLENTYVTSAGKRNCKRCECIRRRMRYGWPRELAETLPKIPRGYSPLNGRFPDSGQVSE